VDFQPSFTPILFRHRGAPRFALAYPARHDKAANRWALFELPVGALAVGGRIMKMTSKQLFAAPKVAHRAKGRIDRGMEAVSAARTRATEIAQQCAALPRLVPTNASQRRRLARLRLA
jgi:hypothetical protein